MLWSIAILIPMAAQSQNISPQVIAGSGSSQTAGGYSIDYTMGELSTSSLSAGNNQMTQGFHQPEIKFVSLDEPGSEYLFQLYPNPTDQYVTFTCSGDQALQIHLFDAYGRLLSATAIFEKQITLDLGSLAAGTYLLQASTAEGKVVCTYSAIKKSNY